MIPPEHLPDRPPAKPFLIELEEEEVDPGLAPAIPEEDGAPEGEAMRQAAALMAPRRSALGRFALWAFGALFSFVLSVAAYDFVMGLFRSNSLLGWIAFALVLLAVLALLLLALRELLGVSRLKRIDRLREAALRAHEAGDLKAARAISHDVAALYQGRADVIWGQKRLAEAAPEVMDADALLLLTEVELLAPLDAQATAVVEASARRVAAATAIVPLALVDVAVALYTNLAMIRRIADIYGGRSGILGSVALLRKVFSALLAAGAVAIADDMVGALAGGGVLSKLSRRFGEGVVNGALTARVGIAAIEMCRPLPFRAAARPGVSATISRALAGFVPRGRRDAGTEKRAEEEGEA